MAPSSDTLSGRLARRKRGVAAALISVALIAAGCGDDGESGEPVAEDLTKLYCPMKRAGKEAGVDKFEPAENSFDTSELIGMPLEEAQEYAAQYGCEIYVSVADGEGQPVPIEINLKAIYVYTEDGVVDFIEGVGGGL
jgi:hypothetical protein